MSAGGRGLVDAWRKANGLPPEKSAAPYSPIPEISDAEIERAEWRRRCLVLGHYSGALAYLFYGIAAFAYAMHLMTKK